jgi:hypothetical protein
MKGWFQHPHFERLQYGPKPPIQKVAKKEELDIIEFADRSLNERAATSMLTTQNICSPKQSWFINLVSPAC